MSRAAGSLDKYLAALETGLIKRYNFYTKNAAKRTCTVNKRSINSLDFDAFNINFSALSEAVKQIRLDIDILNYRRGKLIGNMRISEGKIAGIIVYRLTKAQIIHFNRLCNNCGKKCHPYLNIEIALKIGLDYIHKKFDVLPEGICEELVYTIKHRHVNQETLGLVFDTLKQADKPRHARKKAIVSRRNH